MSNALKDNDSKRNKWAMINKAYRLAWADPAYKEQFMKDPVAALKELGVELPEDKKIIVYEDNDERVYFRLPSEKVQPHPDEDREARTKWSEIVNKAFDDPQFREKLIAEPLRVVRENGFPLPEGKDVQILIEEPGTDILIIPPPPFDDALSDEELDQVAGGGNQEYGTAQYYASTCCR